MTPPGDLTDLMDRLDATLELERTCMREFRFDDLLTVVREKKAIHDMLQQRLAEIGPADQLDDLPAVKRRARSLREKAKQNGQLAKASGRVVGEILRMLGSPLQAEPRYDHRGRSSTGQAREQASGATLSDSV